MKEARNYKLDHSLRVSSKDLVDQLHFYDLDLKSNHIYLMGVDRGYEAGEGLEEPGVDYVMANRFIRNFNLCMRANPRKPILIHLKSSGGSWEEGMAIYDTIRSCAWPVTILNYTHARSMTSIILQAANKRVMMPNSTFMFHEGTLSAEGTVKQVKSFVKYSAAQDTRMLDIYVKSIKNAAHWQGKTEKQIKHWLQSNMDAKEDVYQSAAEAVKYGFADDVFDYDWSALTEYNEEQLAR